MSRYRDWPGLVERYATLIAGRGFAEWQVVSRDKVPPIHGLARPYRRVPSVSAFPAAPYKQLAWRSAADSCDKPACGSSAAPAMQRPSTTDPPPAAVRPAAYAAHNIALGCRGLWRTSICANVQAASGAQCPSTAAGTTPAVKAVLKANYPAAVFAAAANYAEDVRAPLLPGLPALHVLMFSGAAQGRTDRSSGQISCIARFERLLVEPCAVRGRLAAALCLS